MEIDPDAADKLQVCRADFVHAFENDIKPVGTTKRRIFITSYFFLSRLLELVKTNSIRTYRMVLSFGDHLLLMFSKKANYVFVKH